MIPNSAEGTAFVAGGAVAGAWVSVTVGGMGLAFQGTAVSLGMAPVTVAGAVAGAATYGVFKAIVEGDASALATAAVGGLGGAGVSITVGGMGLAFHGTAVSLGMAPVTVAGAVVGLAVYGLLKIIDKPRSRETAFQAFERMEEKVLHMSAYNEALMELDAELSGEAWKQKFAALEIEEELQTLKAQMLAGSNLGNKMHKHLEALKAQTWSEDALKLNFTQFKNVDFNFSTSKTSTDHSSQTTETEAEALFIQPEPSQTWKCEHILKGHSAIVNSVSISPDGQTFASGSDDKIANLWNLKTGKRIYTFFGQALEIYSVAISPDGQTLASGSFDGKISSWNLPKREYLHTYFYLNSPYSHSGFVYSVAFSPDGNILASGSGDKTIRLWNRHAGTLRRTLNGHSDAVLSVTISPDGQTLASGSADNTIRLWSLSSWQQLCILSAHSGWVTCVAISPDGNLLATGSKDNTIKLWKLDTGELLRTLGGQPREASPASGVISVAISPDGQTLASCGTNSLQLWNLCTGELLQTLSGRYCVAFSPDGQTLISGGEGSTIKIWCSISGADQSTLDPILLTKEWYSVLGVNCNTPVDHVKRAYLRLARQYHPDVNPSASAEATMQAVNAAYQEFQQKFNKA